MNDACRRSNPDDVQRVHLDAPARPGGKFRALAVTGNARSPILPDVPTMAEAGVDGVELYEWFGLVAPAGTPPEALRRLHTETIKFLERPETKRLWRSGRRYGLPDAGSISRIYQARDRYAYREIIVSAKIQAGVSRAAMRRVYSRNPSHACDLHISHYTMRRPVKECHDDWGGAT